MKKNFHPSYRPDIDGLRAVAILSVVAFHLSPEKLPGGFVGVDIFFVISGFLISSILFKSLKTGGLSFRDFYVHRIRRIFPALVLVLVCSALYGWFRLMPSEYKQLGRHLTSSAAFFQNFRLRSESGYFDTDSDLKPLLHLWSLSIEEQFYLLFPALLWGAWRLKINLLLMVLGLAGISFILNVHAVSRDAVAAFFLPQNRFWELLAGALLAYFTGQHATGVRTRPDAGLPEGSASSIAGVLILRNLVSWLGAGLILVSVALIGKSMAFPGWMALAPVLGGVLIIQAGPGAWVNRRLLSARPMVWVGLISYPLYLWHWPLIAFAKIELGETLSPQVKWAVLAASFLLAWLTYRFVEGPLRFGRQRSGVIAMRLTAAAVAVLVMGLLIAGYRGLGFRYPGLIPDLRAGQFSYPAQWRGGVCGLDRAQDYDAFGRECFGEAGPDAKANQPEKSLLLWGDSYATHLYPGLESVLSDQYRIAQLTTFACPPILGFVHHQRTHCTHINDSILDYLKGHEFDVVMLAANWQGVGIEGLSATLDELKRIAHHRIILVGPPPRWVRGLPRTLFEIYLKDPSVPLPDRLMQGLSEQTSMLDDRLAALASSKGIDYVSALKGLCDERGCLALDQGSVVAFDQGHLTATGSQRLVAAVRQSIAPVK